MPVDLERFVGMRPFLFHVTARENAHALVDTMSLTPAESLLRWSGRTDLLRQRRSAPIRVKAGVHDIVLKDQAPLRERNVELAAGWDFGDLVAFLNQHVFFWPGTAAGPIGHGRRLRARYEISRPLVLRLRTSSLLEANPTAVPLFASCNSGAPRMQMGRRVSRGPDIFTLAEDFPRREAGVVEVAFRSEVVLPADAEIEGEDSWRPLASLAA